MSSRESYIDAGVHPRWDNDEETTCTYTGEIVLVEGEKEYDAGFFRPNGIWEGDCPECGRTFTVEGLSE